MALKAWRRTTRRWRERNKISHRADQASAEDPGRARVVHVSSAHPANDPRIFEKECTTLARSGYDVTLVATGEVPQADFQVVGLPRRDRRRQRMTVGAARAVAEAVRRRPDLVHLHDPELIPWIPILRAMRIKVVFDSHEDLEATMLHKPYLNARGRRLAASAGRLLTSYADLFASGIVAATPSILEDYSNSRSSVVQNFPILSDWLVATPRSTHVTLAYVGAISVERGIFQMLEALLILNRWQSVTLRIAGAVDPDLLSQMQQHSGWEHVDFRGVVDRAGVADLLASSAVGLVLFQPLPNHTRSQPTKMFEYMAAGLPVVASNFPLWRDLISNVGCGMVVDPTDAISIADGIEELMSDDKMMARMGRQGRQMVEAIHSWESQEPELLTLYSEVLGEKAARPLGADT